jgi:hypothetical protein
MDTYFDKVKAFITELEYDIVSEDQAEELIVVDKEEEGIKNLIIDCEDDILLIEGFLFEVKEKKPEMLEWLLKQNRNLIHGAFVLDDTGKKVLFRDTLQLENLDINEIEASLNSLQLLLSEYMNDLIEFSKH